jgi:hypothetical protein
MSLATNKSSLPTRQALSRRVWNVPDSRAKWLWLAFSALLFLVVLIWYFYAVATQPFPGPFNDPFRLFGIIAFCLVLGTAAYSLRRRFARNLPGKVQDWLWMHVWLGIAAILIALLHENFLHILHNYCQNLSCFSEGYAGTSALLALILLVASGLVGRLLDAWQARVIAQDASANGAGIARALEERLLALEYTVERLCAGKSEPFQAYCMAALEQGPSVVGSDIQHSIPPQERAAFQQASETLLAHAALSQSLHRQRRARAIMHTWRIIHMTLASVALLVILYHALMELSTSVLHL